MTERKRVHYINFLGELGNLTPNTILQAGKLYLLLKTPQKVQLNKTEIVKSNRPWQIKDFKVSM